MTDRNELERLLDAATDGPWEPEYDPIGDSDEHATAIYLPGFAGQIGTFIAYCQHNWNDAYAGEHRISWKEATSNAALICFLRNNAQHYLSLMDEVEMLKRQNDAECFAMGEEIERLRDALSKANTPQWYYAEGWDERCLHSPDEVIDWLDFAPGQYVTEVATARPCESIWCAVRVTDDEDADRRYSFTEHSTEEGARQALGETHDN